MIQERNIATSVILTIVTCGIYGIFWFISMTDDTRIVSGDQKLSGGTAFLLTLVTCGIYRWYWSYQMGKALYQAKTSRGMADSDNSVMYLVLSIFGLDIVNYCLMQSDLNSMSNKTVNQ